MEPLDATSPPSAKGVGPSNEIGLVVGEGETSGYTVYLIGLFRDRSGKMCYRGSGVVGWHPSIPRTFSTLSAPKILKQVP